MKEISNRLKQGVNCDKVGYIYYRVTLFRHCNYSLQTVLYIYIYGGENLKTKHFVENSLHSIKTTLTVSLQRGLQ